MNKLFLLLMISLIFASCEKDDICIEKTTPHLIIRFYDRDDVSTIKAVTQLSIIIDSDGNPVPINLISRDSIVIPLHVTADFTKIKLTKFTGETNENTDEFKLNYNRKQVFISRACGYKMNFEDIELSDLDTTWISNFDIKKTTIDDENQAHMVIFH